MIWEFSIEPDALEPRVVEARFAQDKRSNKHDFVSDIPPLLHTCRSARKFAFKVIKLLFSSKNDTHPMYFHPEIDSLFLREYTFDVGFHQSLALLRGLPDKDQIQRIMLSPNPLIDKFQIVDFPNLKSTEPRKWDAMDYEQISKFPLYFRIKWDGFNAKVGQTHFLSAIELICHGAMWTCNEQRFLGTVSREAVFLGISWKRPEEGEMARV